MKITNVDDLQPGDRILVPEGRFPVRVTGTDEIENQYRPETWRTVVKVDAEYPFDEKHQFAGVILESRTDPQIEWNHVIWERTHPVTAERG